MAKKTIEEYVTLPDGSKIRNHVRHDFDKPTRLLLQHLVGGVCSNPDCLNHTIGANIQRNNYAGNGVAAHICAAAPGPGAARYDKDQTKEERQSYKNGIWLCGSCSIIIDRDEVRYPVELIKDWKLRAEQRAMTMIGQKSITPFERQNSINEAIIQTVQSLVSGTNPLKPKAVESLASYEAFLNSLDSRFYVKVTANSDSMFSEVYASPGHDSSISIILNQDAVASAQTAWQAMLERGQGFSIPTSDFEFKGSRLFEFINNERPGGVLTISPKSRNVDATIYFFNDFSEFELATCNASMSSGTKRLAIEGKVFDGMFTFKYEYLIDAGTTNFSYNFNIEFWSHQKITDLKHYNRLLKAYKFISAHGDLKIRIEIHVDNREISLGVGPPSAYRELFDRISSIMHLAECSTRIASHFSRPLRFRSLDLSSEEENMIIRYSETLNGNVVDTFDSGFEISTAILKDVPPEMMIAMEQHDITSQLRFIENTTFNFFGNCVTLPKMVTDMDWFELNLFSSISSKNKGSLFCIIYAVANTKAVRYIVDGEYLFHKD